MNMCYCSGGICTRIGLLSVYGPSQASVFLPGGATVDYTYAGTSFKLLVTGNGLKETDVLRITESERCTVNATEKLWGRDDPGPYNTPHVQGSNSMYEEEMRLGGLFTLCWCGNSTGGCTYPQIMIQSKLIVRGPASLSISDVDLEVHSFHVTRELSLTLFGTGLSGPNDYISLIDTNATTCGDATSGTTHQYVRDLTRGVPNNEEVS